MELNSTPTTPERDTRTTRPASVIVREVATLTLGQMDIMDYEQMSAEQAAELREELGRAFGVLDRIIMLHEMHAPR